MKPAWLRWLWVSVMGLSMFALTLIVRGIYDFFGYSDAALVPGAVLLSIAGLRLIYRSGVYDASGYGVKQFFSSFRREKDSPSQPFFDYQQAKMMKRKQTPFVALPYLVVGGTFILLSYLFSTLALGA